MTDEEVNQKNLSPKRRRVSSPSEVSLVSFARTQRFMQTQMQNEFGFSYDSPGDVSPNMHENLPSVTSELIPVNKYDSSNSSDDENDTDDARPSGTLELLVPNISKFQLRDFVHETKILSPEPTMIRCLPWRIIFMLRSGNSTTSPSMSNRTLGFFVQCNGESESSLWHCHARAKLVLVAQKPGCANLTKSIEHSFFVRENDWGFSCFISWADLINPDKGFVIPPSTKDKDDTEESGLKRDSVLLRVKVHADAPHGVDWDSKRFTGFVGLKNQGATCYMNSLLQAIYFTNKLRGAVFLMPTESDDCNTSVPLALQRVFYELQFGDRAGNTKRLTRSFGWETLDSFMQHDAQELCRVLLDNMENKMKGTAVEGVIPQLFCGRMLSYIRCKHVPYESKREETFYDIQLKVKGNRNIYEAFDEYIAVESLDGENKYDAGTYGLQDAEKGVIFTRFPPVLYLQLMRFQYDCALGANVKINDRFEFPYALQLDKYLRTPDPPNPVAGETQRYILHAVLVHSGDNHGGHYVAYLNPRADNRWYKFDDDVVSRCSRKEAMNLNFGGTSADTNCMFKQCTNAYMLVYIRESSVPEVLSPVTEENIPATLLTRFREEKRVEAAKRRVKAEAHLYTHFNLILDEDFYGWQGIDLCNYEFVPCRRVRVPKAASHAELLRIVCEAVRHQPDQVRLWAFQIKRNVLSRITSLEFLNPATGLHDQRPSLLTEAEKTKEESEDGLTLSSATSKEANAMGLAALDGVEQEEVEKIKKRQRDKEEEAELALSRADSFNGLGAFLSQHGYSSIWLQRCKPDQQPFDPDQDLLVFLKFFTPKSYSNCCPGALHFVGWISMHMRTTLAERSAELCERAQLPPDTNLLFYEETRQSAPRLLDPHKPIEDSISFTDGNVIVYQVASVVLPVMPLKRSSELCLRHYYKDLYHRVCVQFVERRGSWHGGIVDGTKITVIAPDSVAAGELLPAPEAAFLLCLSTRQSYTSVVRTVARHLRCRPDRIQLFRAELSSVNMGSGNCGMNALPSDFLGSLKELLGLSFVPVSSNSLVHLLHHHHYLHHVGQQQQPGGAGGGGGVASVGHPNSGNSLLNQVQQFNQLRLSAAMNKLYGPSPAQPIEHNVNSALPPSSQAWCASNPSVPLFEMFYQRLALPIKQLESLCQLRCMFVEQAGGSEPKELIIVAPRHCTVGALTATAQAELIRLGILPSVARTGEDSDQNGWHDPLRLRLLEVLNSWIIQQFAEDRLLSSIQLTGNRIMRLERFPVEEQALLPRYLSVVKDRPTIADEPTSPTSVPVECGKQARPSNGMGDAESNGFPVTEEAAKSVTSSFATTNSSFTGVEDEPELDVDEDADEDEDSSSAAEASDDDNDAVRRDPGAALSSSEDEDEEEEDEDDDEDDDEEEDDDDDDEDGDAVDVDNDASSSVVNTSNKDLDDTEGLLCDDELDDSNPFLPVTRRHSRTLSSPDGLLPEDRKRPSTGTRSVSSIDSRFKLRRKARNRGLAWNWDLEYSQGRRVFGPLAQTQHHKKKRAAAVRPVMKGIDSRFTISSNDNLPPDPLSDMEQYSGDEESENGYALDNKGSDNLWSQQPFFSPSDQPAEDYGGGNSPPGKKLSPLASMGSELATHPLPYDQSKLQISAGDVPLELNESHVSKHGSKVPKLISLSPSSSSISSNGAQAEISMEFGFLGPLDRSRSGANQVSSTVSTEAKRGPSGLAQIATPQPTAGLGLGFFGPKREADANSGLVPASMVVFCGHYVRGDPMSGGFGLPFTMVLKHNEPVLELRDRLAERLQANERDVEKWRLVVMPGPIPALSPNAGVPQQPQLVPTTNSLLMMRPTYLTQEPTARVNLRHFCTPALQSLLGAVAADDTDSEADVKASGITQAIENATIPAPLANILLTFGARPWLGIEHRMPQKRPRYSFAEKPIRIFN